MTWIGIHLLDWTVLAVYIAGITLLGWYSNRKVKSSGDYFMGGRRFGKVLMIAQAFGTGTRTDQAVAVMGASAQVGLAGIWYQWLFLFSTPFFWLIAPLMRRMRYITIGDFFEKRFGPQMGATYAFVGLVFFTVQIGIMLKAAGVTIEALTDGAILTEVAVIAMMLFFLVYGLLGGLVSAVTTQFVQGIFILILSFLLIPFALVEASGMVGIRELLPADREWFSLVATEEVTGFFILMSVINALVGVAIYPHHMAINGAGKDEMSCRSGWTFGNFIKRFATLGWAFTGIFVAALFPEIIGVDVAEREQAFGVAVRSLLPIGFVGIMIAAMVAGVVACANAYMVNGSALFTRNFYLRYLRPEASEDQSLTVARFSGLAIVVIGVGFALLLPSVIDGLILLWKIMAFLGIAFWTAIVWRRANRYGAWTSMLVAAVLAFGTEALGWSFPAQVALYLPVGFICMIVVSALTKPEPTSDLNAFYSLLRTPVGEEGRLREAGIEIIHESEQAEGQTTPAAAAPATIPLLADDVAAKNGQSLLLTNLLQIHKNFSFQRYRVDFTGFLGAWAVVLGIIGIAYLLAQVGSG